MRMTELRVRGVPPEAVSSQVVVIGRVSLWGLVVECERGWRAQLAYPERLFVGCGPRARDDVHIRAADALERNYGVPAVPRATIGVDALLDDVAELAPG
jgi:hypothetical protein